MWAFLLAMYKATDYHYLYDTARWKRLRLNHLQLNPLCVYCLEADRITEATICDHIEPHKGDEYKFFNGKLQSLCKAHHDKDKKREEMGLLRQPYIGLDGWPIDLNGSKQTEK